MTIIVLHEQSYCIVFPGLWPVPKYTIKQWIKPCLWSKHPLPAPEGYIIKQVQHSQVLFWGICLTMQQWRVLCFQFLVCGCLSEILFIHFICIYIKCIYLNIKHILFFSQTILCKPYRWLPIIMPHSKTLHSSPF